MQNIKLRSGKLVIMQNNSQSLTESPLNSFRRMARHHLKEAATPNILPKSYNPKAVVDMYAVGTLKFQALMLEEHRNMVSSRYIWGYHLQSDTQTPNSSSEPRSELSRSDSPNWNDWEESDIGSNEDDELL